MNAVDRLLPLSTAKLGAGFPIRIAGESDPVADTPALIADLLGTASIAALLSPFSGGKTAVAVDICCCLATDTRFHGLRVTQTAFLYHAREGSKAVDRRFRAWKQRHGMEDARLNGAIVDTPTADYRDDAFVDSVIATILNARDVFGQSVGLWVIDTLNATAGGADENSAADMAAYVAGLQRIIAETGVTILVIHHLGKNKDRGSRGSTALPAALDTELQIERYEDRNTLELKVTKQRDMADGGSFFYTLDSESLGTNEHGEEITAVVAVQAERSEGGKRRKPVKISDGQKLILDALKRALDEGGQEAPASNHIPPHARVVTLSLWERYVTQVMVDKKPDAVRMAMRRGSEKLQALGIVRVEGEYAWII